MRNFISYLKNVRQELKHVVWPNNKQALMHVAMIVLISAFTALFIAFLDYGLTQGVNYLITR
ncbi:MAG: preprotein translocase subunit SecE [Candidatus Pacebacteria bacterium]|nr:preprotein translocase subunit SecE [Candidatus Paceibacterota bacterium]